MRQTHRRNGRGKIDHNYALLVQYDGSGFYGYQRQKKLVSVQGALEEAIQVIFREEVTVKSAGRTDTGVHGRGQIVNFHLSQKIDNPGKFIISMNGIMIEKPLRVLAIREMPENFSARFSCTEREYEYLVLNSRYQMPLYKNHAHWVKTPLDIEKIREEAQHIIGRHHFTSFTKPTSLVGKSPERKITYFDVACREPGIVSFQIRGTGFLHNMVRILIGTLIDMGTGRINDRNMKEIIAARDRKAAGKTLPPQGLYFVKARYADFPEIEEMYGENFFPC